MPPLPVLLVCALATIVANCWHVAAFIAFPSLAAVALPKNDAGAGLMAYAGRAAYGNDAAATGRVAFRPHVDDTLNDDDAEANEEEAMTNERAVYDPGDELLRTLNTELAANGHEWGTQPEEPDYADTVFNELEGANQYGMLRKLEQDLSEEQDIVTKSALLMKLLEDPAIETLPVVYVEEGNGEETQNIMYPAGAGMSKRSRYYRRYPWKRHNKSRSSTYEPELRYACTPTKEDIFKLLINLHENRKGNHSKTVNFCNRKRPAKAIFTNIRFLG